MIVEDQPSLLRWWLEPFEGLGLRQIPYGLAIGAALGAAAWCLAALGLCPTGLAGYGVLVVAKEGVAILLLSAWYIAWVRVGGKRRMARTDERLVGLLALLIVLSCALYAFGGGPGRRTPPDPYLPPTATAATVNLFQGTVIILVLGGAFAVCHVTFDAFRSRSENRELDNRKPPLDLSGD